MYRRVSENSSRFDGVQLASGRYWATAGASARYFRHTSDCQRASFIHHTNSAAAQVSTSATTGSQPTPERRRSRPRPRPAWTAIAGRCSRSRSCLPAPPRLQQVKYSNSARSKQASHQRRSRCQRPMALAAQTEASAPPARRRPQAPRHKTPCRPSLGTAPRLDRQVQQGSVC